MKKLFIPVLLLLFNSCYNSSDPDQLNINTDLIQNVPVSSNVTNAYSYVIAADNFTSEHNLTLDFDSTSFVCSLTIAAYKAGTLDVQIFNKDSSETFVRKINSGTVITEFPSFKPEKLHLVLDQFTGNVSLSLASDD